MIKIGAKSFSLLSVKLLCRGLVVISISVISAHLCTFVRARRGCGRLSCIFMLSEGLRCVDICCRSVGLGECVGGVGEGMGRGRAAEYEKGFSLLMIE